MAILIKGMEMPKNCLECTFYRQTDPIYDYCCISSAVPKSYVPNDCPLIEVPPHGDLIDRNELCEDIEQSVVFSARSQKQNAEIRGAFKVYDRIKVAPTVIEAEEEK